MIHPIPPGTRDVLPDEMRELRRLQRALIDVFEARGYGEVATPAIEYDEVMATGEGRGARSYRFFDEGGELLALRSDMTVPIARLVATRFPASEAPHRLCYLGSTYRAVLPQRGQMRELVQVGVELIGASPAEGTVEVIEVLEAALDAAGLGRAVIGLGDADLYRQLLEELGVEGEAKEAILASLATHDLVGIEEGLTEAGIAAEQVQTSVALTQLRGGSEVLEQARGLGGAAVERATARLSETYEALERTRSRRPRPDRPRPAARPRLLQRRDRRGLRPGAGPRARRRRPLRRPDEALRHRSLRGRLRPLPGPRPHRPAGGGAPWLTGR